MHPLRRLGLVGLVGLLGLGGCGGVHTPSGVTVVRPVPADPGLTEPDIRKVAPGPVVGATPEQLVRGFLAAESNDDGDHAVAREFLAPNVVWNPSAGVSIYDPATVVVRTSRGGHSVHVGADVTGLVGNDGTYSPATGALTDAFVLARVGTEWRITALPAGLRLTEADVDRTYRRVTVWFLAPGRPILIAEPLLLPVPRQALPTAVVRALLRGPNDRLASAVRTAVPPGLALLGTAAVVEGVVGVDVSSAASGMSAAAVRDLLAQLGATLAALPAVTGIRLTQNGRPLAGLQTVLTPTAAMAGYETDGIPPDLAAFAVSGTRLIQVTSPAPRSDRPPDQRTPPDAGAGGPLHSPAVSPDGIRIAVLRDAPGGRSVLTGPVHGALNTRLPAGPYASPSWGPDGELWLVRGGSAPSLLVLTGARAPVAVALPATLATAWGPGQLRMIRMARDGVRAALIFDDGARSSVVSVAVIRSGGRYSLASLGDIAPALPLVADAAWESSGRLVILGAAQRHLPLRPYEVAVDGSGLSQVSTAGLPVAPDSVTAAPGLPLVVGADNGIWALTSGWLLLRRGTDPVYAG